jgi:hypothetical protein
MRALASSFLGGLSIPLSQAILAHLFSYNMTWSATKKEVERSNFFKEVPKIMKRWGSFTGLYTLCVLTHRFPDFGSRSLSRWLLLVA